MMMRVIVSMNDGRADRCSHFRCRKTCTHACIYIYDKHTCQFGRSSNVQFLVGRNFFNSFSLLSILYLSLFLTLSIYLSLSLYLSLTSLLTSNLSLGASALACMFFLPSVPHSFLPSFIPLLLPPTGTFLIPSFSSFAFLASFPFSLYCKGHTATPHGAVSEYFVGSGVLNRWKKRFFRFPFSNSRFPFNSVFSFLFSVVRFQFSASVLRFPVYAFHFPFSIFRSPTWLL